MTGEEVSCILATSAQMFAALRHSIEGLPQPGVAGQTREGCRSTIKRRLISIVDE